MEEMTTGTEQELLKKMLFYARIRTAVVLVVAILLVLCGILIVPKAIGTINQANQIMEQATETISLANTAIESVTTMSQSITDMGTNMDTFITDNGESVEAVMTKLEEIDFEGLNTAIKDLGDVVEPLAKFFGKFGK
ncbi:putative uncharacterized protein [Firmicutes bacterium CAG:534]|nr:putative uncharacterized protein [Firmicutes bacterium CAG:534]